MRTKHDFDIPDDLSPLAKQAAKAIRDLAIEVNGKDTTGGGCRAFYSAREWRDRDEKYGHTAILIVAHDGGDLAPMFNLAYGDYDLNDRQIKRLKPLGVYAEGCTCWYSAVYEI